jgi:type IV pilus assembly protein PilE
MQRKFRFAGFTLLELIIVIIIIGILAILGFTQYGKMVERSRGAEARAVLGDLRKLSYAFYMENGSSIAGIANANLNLGLGANLIPNVCAGQASHYFAYTFLAANPVITLTATRCTGATGKVPGLGGVVGVPQTLILTSTLNTGVDGWTGTGGY